MGGGALPGSPSDGGGGGSGSLAADNNNAFQPGASPEFFLSEPSENDTQRLTLGGFLSAPRDAGRATQRKNAHRSN